MKKELPHYNTDGLYGGSQDWFKDRWMNIGGCGAITACDSCIVLARNMGFCGLYPYDPRDITRDDYISFGMHMKPFLRPRMTGIYKTSIYIEGFREYLETRPYTGLKLTSVEGTAPLNEAAEAIRGRIDEGFPVPYLMLRHRDRTFSDYYWHWFLVNRYDYSDGRLGIKAVTYGGYRWLDLGELWDTGYRERGGIVIYSL